MASNSVVNDNVLVHIGLHKTGTTFLQSCVFNREDLGFERLPGYQEVVASAFVDLGPYNDVPIDCIDLMRAEAQCSAQKGRILVLSHERLSGYPPSGGYDSRAIADRLKSVFPNAKVLIVIREQRSLILSMYLQYITDGGDLPLGRYLLGIDAPMKRVPQFDLRFYEFDLLVSYYASLFGAARVKVLPYELLRQDSEAFIATILAFSGLAPSQAVIDSMGGPVNPRVSASLQLVQRLVNGLFLRSQLSPRAPLNILAFRGISHMAHTRAVRLTRKLDGYLERRWTQTIERFVGNRLLESNGRLAQLLDIDLARFGYCVEQDKPE